MTLPVAVAVPSLLPQATAPMVSSNAATHQPRRKDFDAQTVTPDKGPARSL